jgi:hypothetical protein
MKGLRNGQERDRTHPCELFVEELSAQHDGIAFHQLALQNASATTAER